MKILLLSKGQRGQACLEQLVKDEFEVQAVVQQRKDTDDTYGIDHLEVPNINATNFLDTLKFYDPDIIVSAGFTQIIKNPIIDYMDDKLGIVNLHGGRLPEYRGGSPLNWQIINGEKELGISIHYLVREIDGGGVLAESSIPFGENETIKDAYEKVNSVFPTLLSETLKDIQIGVLDSPKQQDGSKAVYYGSRWSEDSYLDWTSVNAKQAHDFIRALSEPLDGAYSFLGDKRIHIMESKMPEQNYKHQPGKVFLKREGGVVVMAQDKGLIVTRVKDETGQEYLAKDFFAPLGINTYFNR